MDNQNLCKVAESFAEWPACFFFQGCLFLLRSYHFVHANKKGKVKDCQRDYSFYSFFSFENRDGRGNISLLSFHFSPLANGLFFPFNFLFYPPCYMPNFTEMTAIVFFKFNLLVGAIRIKKFHFLFRFQFNILTAAGMNVKPPVF